MAWLTGWSYRKSHVINYAAGAGTLYQKQITVHYGSGTDGDDDVYLNSHCRTDFGDVRFTDDDGSTLIDCWMESKVDGDNAVFWFEEDDDLTTQNQALYVYYGKADATYPFGADQAQMDATFLAAAHFYGSEVPPTGWTLTLIGTKQFSEEQANSWFRLYSFTSTSAAWSGRYLDKAISEITTGFKAKAKLSTNVVTAIAGQGKVILQLLLDSTINYEIGYTDDWIVYYGARDSVITGTDGSSTSGTENGAVSTVVEIEKAGATGTVKTYYNGVQQQTKASVSATFNKIRFDLRGAAHVTNQEAKVDYVYIRKFVDPEPAHGSWGSEETGGAPPAAGLLVQVI
jgi:hypothetical protein